MSQLNEAERDRELLGMLLEHPYLDDGLTAEGAFNYLLGRTFYERHQERWRQSARVLAYWMKKSGFESRRTGDVNRYFWLNSRDENGAPVISTPDNA